MTTEYLTGSRRRAAYRRPPAAAAALAAVSAYTTAIAGAEALIASGRIVAGTALHAGVILLLFGHYVRASGPVRESAAGRGLVRLLPILALVPLLRLLSLTTAVRELPPFSRYVATGLPALLAAALAARFLGLTSLRLLTARWGTQAVIALSGLPLGVIAYLLFRPSPPDAPGGRMAILADALILVVFAGCAEELIFRGVLQTAMGDLFGGLGLIGSNVLFAALYLGSLSPRYALFAFVVGLYFGWCVRRSRSLWGVMGAHGALNVVLLLAGPLLAR